MFLQSTTISIVWTGKANVGPLLKLPLFLTHHLDQSKSFNKLKSSAICIIICEIRRHEMRWDQMRQEEMRSEKKCQRTEMSRDRFCNARDCRPHPIGYRHILFSALFWPFIFETSAPTCPGTTCNWSRIISLKKKRRICGLTTAPNPRIFFSD